MSALFEEEVLSVHHWTDRLFSFKTTRSPAFRYENGQFTMIGIEVNGKPLLRAYSLVSPNYADELEFLSIKVAISITHQLLLDMTSVAKRSLCWRRWESLSNLAITKAHQDNRKSIYVMQMP